MFNRLVPNCSQHQCSLLYIGMPHFIVLLSFVLQRFCWFFSPKLKARPSTTKKILTRFVVILALLQWSGPELAISLRRACVVLVSYSPKTQGGMEGTHATIPEATVFWFLLPLTCASIMTTCLSPHFQSLLQTSIWRNWTQGERHALYTKDWEERVIKVGQGKLRKLPSSDLLLSAK